VAVYSQFDLIALMAQPECPICRLIQNDVRRFVDGLLYESSVDPSSQQKFRASRGVCAVHSQLLRETRGYSVPMATLYEAAIDEVLSVLDSAGSTPANKLRRNSGGRQISEKLKPSKRCPCCVTVEASERLYTQVFADGLADHAFVQAFQQSQGLCLTHVRRMMEHAMPQDARTKFVQAQRAIWKKLLAELDLFMARSGERGDGKPVGEEGTSWSRAVNVIGGLQNVFGSEYER